MQEEVEQKTFNIVVSTTKLTARTILNAGKAAIQQQQAKMAGGKQSVRMLLRQNRGVSSVEIDKTNIRGFERYLDLQELRRMAYLLQMCSTNLNQYAKRANECGQVYAADVEDLRTRLDELIDIGKQILSRLADL